MTAEQRSACSASSARIDSASPGSACQVSNSSGLYCEWKSSIPPTDTEPSVSPW